MPELNHTIYSPVALEETGYSGTRIFSGNLVTDEWLSEMSGLKLVDTVDKIRTDTTPHAIENGFSMPIIQGDNPISYDDDEYEKTEPLAAEILKFVQDDIGRVDMSALKRNACLMYPYGFDVQEPVFERREGKIRLKSVEPRMHRTIDKWHVDEHGRIKTIEQFVYAFDGNGSGQWKHIPIPVEKCLLFVHNQEGQNYTGRSEFRPLYREWLIKDRVMKQTMITIDRVGAGIPVALLKDTAKPSSVDANGRTVAGTAEATQKVLQGLQGNESAYAILKDIESLTMFTVDAAALDQFYNTVIKYCDEAMFKSAFQMYMSLGTSQSGARALGDTFVDLYLSSVQAMADEIAAVINTQLIRRLVDWNFGPQKAYPKMEIVVGRDLSAIYKTLADLKQKGLLTGNAELENFFLNYHGLPLTTEANAIKAAPVLTLPGLQQSEHRHVWTGHSHIEMSEKSSGYITLNREPTEREAMLFNAAETVDNLNTMIKSLSMELRKIAEPAVSGMAKEIGDGEKIYSVEPKWGNRVSDLFFNYYRKLRALADSHVKKELGKQRPARMSEFLAAVKKKPVEDTSKIRLTDADYEKWARRQADMESVILSSALKKSVVEYTKAGINQGKDGAGLTEFILSKVMEEVGQRYDTAAGALTGGYAIAREITAGEFADTIGSKIRTEIMDGGTCDWCAEHDGQEFAVDDDSTILPDPECAGAPKCRGIWIYSVKDGK